MNEPVRMFAAQEQINLAFKLEKAVEREIRSVLDLLGCDFNEDTEMDVILRQIELMDINIVHYVYKDRPDESGWYIYKHKQLILIISQPWIDKKGRIKIKRRVIE